METTINIIGIASVKNDKLTKLMQAVDMFEKHKVAAELIELNYKLTFDGQVEKIEDLKKFFSVGLEFAKKEFGKDLVFCHIRSVKQSEISVENTKVIPVFDPNVSVVSDGNKWALLVDVVSSFCKGIVIEESEMRKIKSLTWE